LIASEGLKHLFAAADDGLLLLEVAEAPSHDICMNNASILVIE
jgi:hypothetical protein